MDSTIIVASVAFGVAVVVGVVASYVVSRDAKAAASGATDQQVPER